MRAWAGALAVMAVATVLVAIALKSFALGQRQGRAEVQKLWHADQLLLATQRADQQNFARLREHELQQRLDQLQKENRYAQDEITRRYAVDSQRLRQRPERAVSAAAARPTPAGACVGQTGAGLAGGDAAFLAGYAADAARLAAALELCEVAYEQARCGQTSICYRMVVP
jgi:hypothetical protein